MDHDICTRHISNVPQSRGWEKKIADGPPCVVLASPGFMQVGPSRELFELWAPDARNGLIITGYSIEGTLARVSSVVRSISSIYLFFVFTLCITMDIFPLFSPIVKPLAPLSHTNPKLIIIYDSRIL